MRRLLLPAALCAALSATVACGGDGSAPGPTGGTVVVSDLGDPETLLPVLARDVPSRLAADLLFDPLAELGPSLNVVGDSAFVPRLATRWTWSDDSLAITFALDPDARWHDGQPVRASDVAFALRVIKDTVNASPALSNLNLVDSVSTPDSLHATVHFSRRYAEQFLHATRIVPLPEHQLGVVPRGTSLRTSPVAAQPVGSGRYRLVAREPEVRLEFAVVEDHYRGRAKLDRVIQTVHGDAGAGLAQLLAGETDVWDQLTPAQVGDVAARQHLRMISAPGFFYGFMTFNLRDPRNTARAHPLFADRTLRRALSLGVDRDAVRRAAFDTLGLPGLGPFVRAHVTADTTIEQIPFDRTAAESALDSLGWSERGADGVRRRGNQRLAFTLLVPSTSPPRQRAAVVIQEQLRQVGVDVTVRTQEQAAFAEAATSGRFDAMVWIWQTSPSPLSLRGTWASAALPGGGVQNLGKYESAPFDRAVSDAIDAVDLETRRAALRRAYQQIVDDAPAIWLFEVRSLAAVHRRFNIPAWRSDAWWLTLGEWTVDPAQRLPRDGSPAAP